MKLPFKHQETTESKRELTWKKKGILIASAIAGASLLALLIVYIAEIGRAHV